MSADNLIQRAVQGDKQAFASLYTRYRDRLYRYAYFKLGSESDAQDAVADCVVSAYQGIASLKSETAFDAWIFRILYRSCARQISLRAGERQNQSLDGQENSLRYEQSFEAAELREALDSLSDLDRDIVLLSAVAGYNSREIGKLTGLKPSTVRSRLSRSLAKLKEFLG